jgi:hypothetical protein
MKLSKITDALWRKHSNPWSVWTRLLSTPLTYIPFWNHSRKQGLAVAAWFAANPFLFPEPKNEDTWAARAIRGERQWAKERPRDTSLAIQALGSAAFLAGFYAAYKHKFGSTAISAVVVIACNAWFLNRMTDYDEAAVDKGYRENPNGRSSE